MQILAYNRFVKGLNGLTAATFMERVGALASIEEVATSFEPKEKVLPRFQWNQILYSTAGVGGARVLASLGAAKGTDFHPDVVGGRKTVLRHSDPRLERLAGRSWRQPKPKEMGISGNGRKTWKQRKVSIETLWV
jgi:hypothetical protein